MSATSLNQSRTYATRTAPRDSLTVWQGLVGALGVVAVLAFAAYLVIGVNFINRPFIGAMVTYTMSVNAGRPTGDADWVGIEAGLRTGDQITAINPVGASDPRPLTQDPDNYRIAYARYLDIISELETGTPVQIDFIRNVERTAFDPAICDAAVDGFALCSITVTLTNFPTIDVISYFLLPITTAVVTLGIAILLIRLRFDSSDGIMVAAVAFLSAIYVAGILDIGTDGYLGQIWLMGGALLAGTLATIGLTFPRRLRIVRRTPWLVYVPLIISVGLAAFFVYQFTFPDTVIEQTNKAQQATASASIGLVTLLGLTLIQRERANTPMARDQSNTMLISVSLMFILIVLWLVSRYLVTQTDTNLFFNLEALTLLLLFPNAGFAYAVLQYRHIDTDRAISQGLAYSIMLSALVVSVYLLTLGGALTTLEVIDARDIITISVVLFVMVALFTPVRTNLQSRIDRLYFRQRRDYQREVEEFGRQLTTLDSYAGIAAAFHDTLAETIAPSSLIIFLYNSERGYVAYDQVGDRTDIRFMSDSPLVSMLRKNNEAISLQVGDEWPHQLWSEQAKLVLLKATIVKALKSTDVVNGFVMLGKPRVSDRYSHEDVRFIANLVDQLAIATERTRVIESLERRVRELDVLSQVSQAVNFNIESDDFLLELIYAQTSKLVDVPNFYIALYDDRVEQLYFAFFLENDDRIEAQENIRWNIGNDIFSDLIERGSAVRLTNYADDVEKRGLQHTRVRDDLYAFIGVPLTAGRRRIGVMATGKAEDKTEYSDEQYKIFTDIGALAATSLDKVNLFNQTRMRERQLTVLNDISRQLVATESDVEKLLQIIMNSAVEILNAEAGSLLLNTDDDSGALEFRVVIGGAGDDLLGTRLDAGKGIVGEVVRTAQAQISNDARTDPRHAQQVVEDYVSNSLLAVPLIAKEQVIGVLEVINKTDGTPFVDEDADLLTTFAGQAAVAIENARLFQQTDQQLSQRVRELEALERIDTELSRSQELSAVAEITVRSAMNILKADAGALGIVNEANDVLEMVAIRGYDEDEYPEDADGMLWNLQSGIIGRVIRTRQADIALDVTMDPDYNSRLTDSNSQITLPMFSGEDINAILILEKNSVPRFSLTDWDFGQRIAEHASIAVENAQFYAALLQANRSKSEFMGFAAHELKNPLTSLIGWADLMRQGATGAMSDQQTNMINVIHDNAKRMEVIISDLRDSAKMDANEFSVNPAPMDIHHAVVETLRPFVKTLEGKHQELINEVPDSLPLVWADEPRIIQVLTNLVSNAHKYSPEDTTIRVTAEVIANYRTQDGKLRGRMMRVSVVDQGIGMSEEDQKKLFRERYFRSTNEVALNEAGTGLGMMLTKGIMDNHDGEIGLESTLGEGSTFYIALPLAEDIQQKAADDTQTEPASD